MSLNYRRGRAYEYRCVKMLEATGYTAGRCAGSHGLFDVWAFNGQHWRLVQVKSRSATMAAAEKEQFKLLPTPANTSKELWVFSGKRGQPPSIALL